MGSAIYTALNKKGKQYWSYNEAVVAPDAQHKWDIKYPRTVPAGATITAWIHSHVDVDPGNATFSPNDRDAQNRLDAEGGKEYDYYLTTPDGKLHVSRAADQWGQQIDDDVLVV